MIKRATPSQRFKLSARRLVKTVATSVLPLSAVVGLSMASAPNAVQAAAPPFGPSTPVIALKNIFYFSPWGDQLDGDTNADIKGFHVPDSDTSIPKESTNIYDILIGPNTPLNFDVYLYKTTPAYNVIASKLSNISFSISRGLNTIEWQLINVMGGRAAGCTDNPISWIDGGCVYQWTLSGPTITILPPNNPLFVPDLVNGPQNMNIEYLGRILGKTLDPGFAPHDGEHDFMLILNALEATQPLTLNPHGQFQDVEVQKVPAPLPFFGAAAAIGSIRKLRKFSSLLKTFSMG